MNQMIPWTLKSSLRQKIFDVSLYFTADGK